MLCTTQRACCVPSYYRRPLFPATCHSRYTHRSYPTSIAAASVIGAVALGLIFALGLTGSIQPMRWDHSWDCWEYDDCPNYFNSHHCYNCLY
jgi:hypothetical protein